MKTRTDVLEEIRRKADRDIVEANTRYDIYDKVLTPEISGYCIPTVHIHRLWDTIGAIRWEASRGNFANIPDANLLRTLLHLYKPEPLLQVKSSTTSFRPDTQVWSGDVTAAHSVIVVIESLRVVGSITREVRVMFQWNSHVGADLCRFSVVFDGSAVDQNGLKRSRPRTIRWIDGNSETLWWESDTPIPDFPALIYPPNAVDQMLNDVLSGL